MLPSAEGSGIRAEKVLHVLCDECHARPVALRFQVTNDGQTVERKVCEVCGEKYAWLVAPPSSLALPVPFALLSGMLPAHGASTAMAGPSRCEHCGYSFHQFQHTSLLGCAECYDSFAPQIEVILRRAQGGSVRHAGKKPARGASKQRQEREIEHLSREIRTAVEDQRFEDAARLRDQIRRLEKELENGR